MSAPVVVQGTAVANPEFSSGPPPTDYNDRGEKQETKCRDPLFAALFYVTLIAIIAVAFARGPDAVSGGEDDADYTSYITATIIVVILSFFASGGAMMLMMKFPETLIKAALIFVTALAGLWMVMSFIAGEILMGVLGAVFFAFSLCYAKMVWSRIPFATANLVTACTAIKANLGVTLYAYIFTIVAGVWSVTWSVAFIGIYDESATCDEQNVCDDPSYGALFGLFVAYFFVHQVLQSSVHVTVAGTVGHWWFEPEEANSFCSSAVTNAFIRTVTTSFGSICFGSLIVAILEALRMLARFARDNDDGNGILLCLAECCLSCMASIMEYFNKWAFIYVGLYGYPYMEAGKNVFTLFQNRGWDAIIADDLVGNTLFLVSVVVGGFMGSIALIIAISSDLFEEAGGDEKAIAFMLGFIVGLVICSILMSTIGSGVNAVIVLFAEAPAEFQQNHPQLSQRMLSTWREAFPGSI